MGGREGARVAVGVLLGGVEAVAVDASADARRAEGVLRAVLSIN